MQVVENLKTLLDDNHPETIQSISNLASICGWQGRYDGAEQLKKQVVEKREAIFGEDHVSTLVAIYSLANTLKTRGKIAEAIHMMEQCAQQSERALGSDDRIYQQSMTRLRQWKEEQTSHA